MMTEFDPAKHMLVGVIPESGEHLHVHAPNIEAGISARMETMEQHLAVLMAKLDQVIASHNDLQRQVLTLQHNLAHHDHETIREVAA